MSIGKIKILHLEDLESDAEFVAREIRKGDFEYEIIQVDSREKYLDALLRYQPDIVLSDHSLPMFDSKEALEILNQQRLEIPFILVTSKMSEEFAAETMKRGAYDYVLKDRLQRLPGAIKNAIEKSNYEKERKVFLQRIIENERLFRQVQELARFGICMTDLETMHTSWTDEVYTLFNYNSDEVIPSVQNLIRRMRPKDAARAEQIYQIAATSRQNQHFKFQVTDDSGRLKFFHADIFVQNDRMTDSVKIISFIQDVTQTEYYRNNAIKTEANLNAMFENTETGYIIFDKTGRIMSFNNAGLQWANLELGSILSTGVLYADYLKTGERKKRFEEIVQLSLKGEKSTYESMYADLDGNTNKWYRINSFPVNDSKQQVIGFSLSVSDITEMHLEEEVKKQMTDDLMQRNKNLEQFAYIVSHNLRAPVANIIGFADFLKNRDLEKSEQEEVFHELEVAVTKLDHVIRDLNMILQVNKKIDESRELISFTQITEDILFSLQNLMEGTGFEVQFDFNEVNEIRSIRSYIYSIFYNLISNAFKYRTKKASPYLQIKSRIIDDRIEIEFSDNGIGIDLNRNKDQLFGLYKRFHLQAEGKGIGLFMVKTQIETLRGQIFVNSFPDKGTTFTIYLPI